MDLFLIILTILGLGFFEVIVSVDNAIVNAEVLSKMLRWARKFFLIWGFFLAVLVVRGLLPWIIVWASNPALGPLNAFNAVFSSDHLVKESLESSAPVLLIGGGSFLLLLFLYWFFIESKNAIIDGMGKLKGRFYFWAFLMMGAVVWLALRHSHLLAFGAVVGMGIFFITTGIKENAEHTKKKILHGSLSDWSKILYLEVLDASFSVDSVLGAFAFTMSVPLIMVGNGLGVLIVRQLTVRNINNIKKYRYLKDGAMYSIMCISFIMIFDAFGADIPEWMAPVSIFLIVGYFLRKSVKEMKK